MLETALVSNSVERLTRQLLSESTFNKKELVVILCLHDCSQHTRIECKFRNIKTGLVLHGLSGLLGIQHKTMLH